MKKKIVVCSRFNYSDFDLSKRFGIDPLSEDWIRNRLKIFMNYTRKSLENQTNQNFIACLSTYEESMPFINELLKQYPPLPENIIFTPHKEVFINNYIKDGDLFYLVRIDSDDMYHENYIQKMYDYEAKPNTSCLVCKQGYVYNEQEDVLAYYANTSPSIYTQIFSVSDYLSVYQHYLELSHTIAHRFPYEPLMDRNFIIVVHGHNTWQSFLQSYDKHLITDKDEIIRIKKTFGSFNL
ncbi:MAG: hypothetical protein ACRC1P_00635 [Cellulosilyticaceae bacterium]